MIDHVTLPVRDIDASRRAFASALKPLGYSVVMEITRAEYPELPYEKFVGLGVNGKPDFWLRPARGPIEGNHLAFHVPLRATIHDFHTAALAAGLTDDGQPGLRAHYHPTYYAAFVRDADGHSLEVVCHAAPATKKTAAKKKPAAKKTPAKKSKKSAKKNKKR